MKFNFSVFDYYGVHFAEKLCVANHFTLGHTYFNKPSVLGLSDFFFPLILLFNRTSDLRIIFMLKVVAFFPFALKKCLKDVDVKAQSRIFKDYFAVGFLLKPKITVKKKSASMEKELAFRVATKLFWYLDWE